MPAPVTPAAKPPKAKPALLRVGVSEAARQLGICRQSWYKLGFPAVFTPFVAGKRARVCVLELGEAAQHMRGPDGTARAKAAVLRLRKAMGRLEAGD